MQKCDECSIIKKPHGTYEKMENQKGTELKDNEDKLIGEKILLGMVFMEFVEKRCERNQIRRKLLLDILGGLEHNKKEELLRQIYLYGSMVKSGDLISRQLFLWLLEMAERRDAQI